MPAASHFILYVEDQKRSTDFYSAVLRTEPRLCVPGMTEYALPGGGVLGLMPEAGIQKLLGPLLPDPSKARGTPRSELYLVVAEAEGHHSRSLAAGAKELSPMQMRSWGHVAGYSLDPDGHVLAFAALPQRAPSAG
jgi:predicted enzyme related to lactoylglutathione lyase